MRKYLLSSFMILLVSSVFADSMHLSINAGLMVFDRRAAADSLGNWAEGNGGYFTVKSDEYVVLRVPDEYAEGFRNFVEGISDSILDYGRSTTDLRQEILRLTSTVESREEILARNLELLDSSDVEGTLELEQEIRRLMSEIDYARGRLRRLENDSAMATVSISLSFRSQTLPEHRPSSFNWINGIDFYSFISGYGRPDGKHPGKEIIELPPGFAEIDSSSAFSAISSEGVRMRVVRLTNYPEQDSVFWATALTRDFSERGYLPVEVSKELPVFNEDAPFSVTLWALPVGEDDYLYLVGIRVDGKRLELLEMAGSAGIVMEYLEEW